MAPPTGEVTELLLAWSNGDHAALERLTPLVYQELHRLAKNYMGRERSGHTLQTTALVNDTCDWWIRVTCAGRTAPTSSRSRPN